MPDIPTVESVTLSTPLPTTADLVAVAGAPPPSPLQTRLGSERERLVGGLVRMCVSGGIVGFLAGPLLTAPVFVLVLQVIALLTNAGFSGVQSNHQWEDNLYVLFATAVIGGAVWLTRRGQTQSFSRAYSAASEALQQPGALALYTDDEQQSRLRQALEQRGWLKWWSPPPSDQLEDRLEFAACYFKALRSLVKGYDDRLSRELIAGSWRWYSSKPESFTLGSIVGTLTAFAVLDFIGLPLMFLFHLESPMLFGGAVALLALATAEWFRVNMGVAAKLGTQTALIDQLLGVVRKPHYSFLSQHRYDKLIEQGRDTHLAVVK